MEPKIQEFAQSRIIFDSRSRKLIGQWAHTMSQRQVTKQHEREGSGAYVKTCNKQDITRDKKFLPVQDSADIAAVGEGEKSRAVPGFHDARRPVIEVSLFSGHRQVVLPSFWYHRHDSLDSVMTFQAFVRGPSFLKSRNCETRESCQSCNARGNPKNWNKEFCHTNSKVNGVLDLWKWGQRFR